MCGIAAIIGELETKKPLLKSMLEKIVHRGEPDCFYEHMDLECCSLGMNRLAIVDKEHGVQPMCDSTKRYRLILNGEIYNYLELKDELLTKGYKFTGNTDTEVLLYGCIERQENIVEKINGMYAFIIYDNVQKTFFAARDPLGVKPLYYAKDCKNIIYFASEIKALSFQNSLLQIENFPPGAYMKDNEIVKYFSLPDIDERIQEQEAMLEIRKLVDMTVKSRVTTDLPIAVYVSGGVDSTAVLATACKYHDNATAIIVGNEESTDRKIAERYCLEYNIPYIIKHPPTEDELIENIEKIVEITESFEPNMIRQSSIAYFIAEAAKEFKVILCGEGADEIFAGYPEFTNIAPIEIAQKSRNFLGDLNRTQLQRVDRTSMFFTTEVREPLLDKNLLQYVMTLPVSLKVKEIDDKIVTKYIFRRAMEDRLPEYIYNRPKVVLSEGAGYKGNQKIGGLFYDILDQKIPDSEFESMKKKYQDRNLQTKEEVYYFKIFLKYKYNKADFNKKRTVVNKIDSQHKTNILSQKILNNLTTRKRKRAHPHNKHIALHIIDASIKQNIPIGFVMYRGKGQRNLVGVHEKAALDWLQGYFDQITSISQTSIKLHIIYTDTHARINGFTEQEIIEYGNGLQKLCINYGFDLRNMSDVTPIRTYTGGTHIDKVFLKKLTVSAKKHYRGTQDIQKIAQWYYEQNQREKRALLTNFPNHIFLTYNGKDMNPLFPLDMPIFYLYSTGKGHAEKPWFMK